MVCPEGKIENFRGKCVKCTSNTCECARGKYISKNGKCKICTETTCSCKKGKILNPVTGIFVSDKGRLGKKLIAEKDDKIINPVTGRKVARLGRKGNDILTGKFDEYVDNSVKIELEIQKTKNVPQEQEENVVVSLPEEFKDPDDQIEILKKEIEDIL